MKVISNNITGIAFQYFIWQVYLPAIEGYVPSGMVKTFAAYLDFCYLVRLSVIDENTLKAIDEALERFHRHRVIFQELGVRAPEGPKGLSLPRQHAMKHYIRSIIAFGAPNGLCSSITECMHIRAVKKPWRRSSKFRALLQMLKTNQRLDKLAACRRDFLRRGMLKGSCLSEALDSLEHRINRNPPETDDETMVHDGPQAPGPYAHPTDTTDLINEDEDDEGPVQGERVLNHTVLARRKGAFSKSYYYNVNSNLFLAIGYPNTFERLGLHVGHNLVDLTRRFLYDQLNPLAEISGEHVNLSNCPIPHGNTSVYHSAIATYFAPSDLSGINGMHRERIRANPIWKKGDKSTSRYDCVFVDNGSSAPGFRGMLAAQVKLLFSFRHENVVYPCALVEWFETVGEECDEDTGMWMVKPEYSMLTTGRKRTASVIHLDCVLRGAHLLPIFLDKPVLRNVRYFDALTAFRAFYVNKYIDYHVFETVF